MNKAFTNVKLLMVLALVVLSTHKLAAQSSLFTGDIVFTSYDSRGSSALTDTFSFVLLTPVSPNTEIGFTDRGWNGSSWNTDNGGLESTLKWTTSTAIPAGTEIMIVSTTAYNASTGSVVGTISGNTSTSGLNLQAVDQVIAFQGDLSGSYVVLAGLHWGVCNGATSDANWDAAGSCTVTSSTASLIPPGLTPTTGGFFVGTTNGIARIGGKFLCSGVPFATSSSARAAILDKNNWTFITTQSEPLRVPAACSAFIGIASPSITTQPSSSTVCAGSNNTAFAAAASGTGISYQWQVSTTGTGGTYSNITNGGVYSNATSTTLSVTNATATMDGYAYRLRAVNSGGTAYSNSAVLTVVNGAPSFSVQPSDVAICPGGATIFSASATGGTVTYQWQESSDNGNSFNNIANGGVYSNGTTNSLTIAGAAALMYGYRYRLAATNICGTSYSNAATLTFRTSWTGAVSTAWHVAANWACNILPDANTDVLIGNVVNTPVVTTTTATARNITIQSGSSLTVAANSTLTVGADVINLGTFAATSTGATVAFNSATGQTIPGGTYYNVNIAGTGDKTLSGAVTVNNGVNFAGNSKVFLGANNLTIAGTTGFSGIGANSYIVTNGTGGVKKSNLSAAFLFPIGTLTSYTPATVANSGTVDNLTARVIDGVFANYAGETPQGVPVSSKVVNKTWFISEDIIGGSNASLRVQWNIGDELTSFNRNSVTLSHYTGGNWLGMTPKPATVNGTVYSVDRSDITSFSPFGVGGTGSPLPVKLRAFEGKAQPAGNILTWAVADEKELDNYGVERSDDGKAFRGIGLVKAAGAGNYTFFDEHIAGYGKLYYRLNMIEQTGAGRYSPVVVVMRESLKQAGWKVGPNPLLGDELQILSSDSNTGSVEISIMDVSGKIWYQNTDHAVEVRTVNVKSLPVGIYLLRLKTGVATQTFKLNRQ